MKFAWIQTEKATYPLSKLCRWLGVTPSGYYAWCVRPESTHRRDDRRLKVLVRASFDESKQRYGSPRVHEDLSEQQERVSRKRVVRLMQEEGLKARVRKRYKLTTMSDHDQPVAANVLDRQFEAEAPNQRWVGDTPAPLPEVEHLLRGVGPHLDVRVAERGEDFSLALKAREPIGTALADLGRDLVGTETGAGSEAQVVEV